MGSGQGQVERWDVAYRLKFSGRAVREVGEAHDWYEERSPGLGSEFQLFPELLPGIRRTLLPRFPYGVFYAVRLDLVHVLAVIHNARNPKRWPRENAR